VRTPAGDTEIARLRLLDRELHDRFLDDRIDAVPQIRLAARDLHERRLTAVFVQFLEPVEAVSAEAHHLAGLRDTAQGLRQLQQPQLVLDDLLLLHHLTSPAYHYALG
jgi:hypothetical protein